MSNLKTGLICLMLGIAFSSCAVDVPKKELTVSEQLQVDTKSAEGLTKAFKQEVHFITQPKAEAFIRKTVIQLLSKREEFKNEPVEIKIHDDEKPELRRFFSFPGITLSIPYSFLQKVEYENELAASLSFEIANIINRFLAKKVEAQMISHGALDLFSNQSVFNLDKKERFSSIDLGTKLMYDTGFDIRGMASIFSRYFIYYLTDSASDLKQNQVGFYIREAQRAKSEFLPQMKPVVRSAEFIQFKKGITDAHKRDIRGSKESNGS